MTNLTKSFLILLLSATKSLAFAPEACSTIITFPTQNERFSKNFSMIQKPRTNCSFHTLRASNDQTENSDAPISTNLDFDVKSVISLVFGQTSLVLFAVVAAKILNVANLGLGDGFEISKDSLQNGVLYTLPLFALALLLDQIEKYVPALQDVSKATQRSVLAVLGGTFDPVNAIVVCITLGAAAGVGEEMLFRGVLQDVLVERLGDNFALLSSALIFGALHAVTPLYAILAALASLYFGELFIQYHNLAVPIICHGLYDVGALYFAHVTVCNMSEEDKLSLSNWMPPLDSNK